MITGYMNWLLRISSDAVSHVLKDNSDHSKSNEEDADKLLKVEQHATIPHVSVAGGGTRTGLFRTPISGGVQSATSAHGLHPPALAVRNLMEQVKAVMWFQNLIVFSD